MRARLRFEGKGDSNGLQRMARRVYRGVERVSVHVHPACCCSWSVGVYFTVRTKAVQIRYIKDMFTPAGREEARGRRAGRSRRSRPSWSSTASRVGTGNIAGVATAIATGGPGAVFWMWAHVPSIGAASAFVESTLAQIWKVRGKDGEFRGGPAYYIQQALGPALARHRCSPCCSSCASRLASTGCRPTTPPRRSSTTCPTTPPTARPWPCGIVLAVMTAFVIFGGAKRISVITSILVPIMARRLLRHGHLDHPHQRPRDPGRVPDHAARLGLRLPAPSPAALPARWSCSASSAASSPTRPAWAPPPTPPPPPACRTR